MRASEIADVLNSRGPAWIDRWPPGSRNDKECEFEFSETRARDGLRVYMRIYHAPTGWMVEERGGSYFSFRDAERLAGNIEQIVFWAQNPGD